MRIPDCGNGHEGSAGGFVTDRRESSDRGDQGRGGPFGTENLAEMKLKQAPDTRADFFRDDRGHFKCIEIF